MQRVFDFYRNESARRDGLFFALFPDSGASRGIAQFGAGFIREHQLKGKRLAAERLHVSLQNVGDYPRLPTKFVYAAKRAGDAVTGRPFEVEFHAIMSFAGAPPRDGRPRRRPLVMLGKSEALSDLHKTLGSAMQTNGLRAASSFTPHMTLLYGPETVPMQAIEPIRVAVREFTLIHSERGESLYHLLCRWRLKD